MDVSNTKKCITDIKNLDQWICYTNTRYNSLESHMQYMKMLWHEVQPNIPELKKNVHSLGYHNSETKISDSVEAKTPTQMNYNNSLKEFSDNQFSSTNNNDDTKTCDSNNPTANVENILPKISLKHREEETIKNLNAQKEIRAEVIMATPRTYSLPQSARISRPMSPSRKENKYKECNDNWQYPSWNHLSEYSQGLVQDTANTKKSFENLILEDENEMLLQELTSVRDDIKLNSSRNAKSGALGKNKIRAKGDKKEKIISSALSSKKGSLSKLDDITSLKFKKRRRKLHSCNSKSTVATRDTNFLGRKDTKKRKQKNTANNRQVLKPHQTSNEVVEIYHNAATKSGSTPVILSKHPKLDCHMNYSNRLSSATNKQQTVHAKSKCENTNYQHNTTVDESNRQDSSEKQCQSKQKTEGKSMNVHDKNCNVEIAATPAYAMEKFNSHNYQQSVIQAAYCDPMITHNYEMPTLASKLKRVNRSYFSRFNFRNIPFVVGTSVTPSHNLGLNIQQVLSIMKTRQPAANGITPVLIRKVSKGIKPVSILMGQINDRCTKFPYMNSEIITTSIEKENLFISSPDDFCKNEDTAIQYRNKRLSTCTLSLKSSAKQYENLQETVKSNDMYESCNKKKDTKSENQLDSCNTAQISKNPGNTKLLKLFSSQQNVKTQMETLDIRSKNYQGSVCDMDIHNIGLMNPSQSSKGIKDVLINLHDQFEDMNTKYEKLQEKTEKHDDKKLEEEMTTLEKELIAKEDEINAVVNLYQEVMALKQQMKLLQSKNSYVCISTEVPFGPHQSCSSGPFTLAKSYGKNLQQKLQHRKGTIVPPREPTSLRLAGLLRQIQTFQKQLSSR